MTGTSVLAQFRAWLRAECPLIDKNDKFNANYIGATATEYTIRTAGDRHRYDITGKDSPTYNLTFEARLPFGAAAFALLLNVVSDFGRAGQRMRRECKKEEEIDKFLRRELHKIMI